MPIYISLVSRKNTERGKKGKLASDDIVLIHTFSQEYLQICSLNTVNIQFDTWVDANKEGQKRIPQPERYRARE